VNGRTSAYPRAPRAKKTNANVAIVHNVALVTASMGDLLIDSSMLSLDHTRIIRDDPDGVAAKHLSGALALLHEKEDSDGPASGNVP
jgi:hypothetical protein